MHLTNIVFEVIRTISSLFIIIFLQESFKRTKTRRNQKNNQQNKNKRTKKKQRHYFLARTKTSKRVKIVCCAFWCFFYAQNLFVKNRQTWNCPDNLKYNITDVRCSMWPRCFFLQMFFPVIVHLHKLFLLRTRVAQMWSSPRWASRRKDVK